jgi:hypothetical protein
MSSGSGSRYIPRRPYSRLSTENADVMPDTQSAIVLQPFDDQPAPLISIGSGVFVIFLIPLLGAAILRASRRRSKFSHLL